MPISHSVLSAVWDVGHTSLSVGSRNVNNARSTAKKPYKMQVPQAQAHHLCCQECAGQHSGKELCSTSGEELVPVEFSSDDPFLCDMVVRLFLLLCSAFLRVTAG